MTPDEQGLARDIGRRLRHYRQDKGLSQEGLSRMAGVTMKTINRTEMGHSLPSIASLYGIAEALDVTLIELLADREYGPGADAAQGSEDLPQSIAMELRRIVAALQRLEQEVQDLKRTTSWVRCWRPRARRLRSGRRAREDAPT